MVDIHPCGANERGRIPRATWLPARPSNFLPAGKIIGVTHLTNCAFRLHPIEWMVGEAAGTVAPLAIAEDARPDRGAIQSDLARDGVPLVWFDDLPMDHLTFAAIQIAAFRFAPRSTAAGWPPTTATGSMVTC
jgi:FAD dependent oxidoreductase